MGFSEPQKTIQASWLYDEIGSALFEAITLLPEYGLTRADARLLRGAAGDIVARAEYPDLVVELGSGSGTKTRHLLAARRGPVEYVPIDISRAALQGCVAALGGMDDVRIRPVEGTYLDGTAQALAGRAHGRRALLLFLGSTIGNFSKAEAAEFLGEIRVLMRPGDSLLLGADLVKPRTRLIDAYDDPAGVTAAFNLNLLGRVNRELGGEFVLRRFAHEARYDEAAARVEMHLRSLAAQTVRIAALDCEVRFQEGETIWTESSHKFRADEIEQMGLSAGWAPARQWIDADWGFAETLFHHGRY